MLDPLVYPFNFFFLPFSFKVQEELLQLQSKADGRCAYVTVVQTLYGPIWNIIHDCGGGTWNPHVISEELRLLLHFVLGYSHLMHASLNFFLSFPFQISHLFSSVPLGNL